MKKEESDARAMCGCGRGRGFRERVCEVVMAVPPGMVTTYGRVASMVESPRAARAVGTVLHTNPFPGQVPCHRVVDRWGRLSATFAFGGLEGQRALLEREGVRVRGGRVCLARYLWTGENALERKDG